MHRTLKLDIWCTCRSFLIYLSLKHFTVIYSHMYVWLIILAAEIYAKIHILLCSVLRVREKYRLCRICTFHLKGGRSVKECEDIFRLWGPKSILYLPSNVRQLVNSQRHSNNLSSYVAPFKQSRTQPSIPPPPFCYLAGIVGINFLYKINKSWN